MKNLYILGAAGSIGLQTLDVIEKHMDSFNLVGISLGSNEDVNHSILKRFQPELVCLRTIQLMNQYQTEYPTVKFTYGEQGLLEIAHYPKQGILLNALSGSAGLKPTVEAIKTHKDIALANKETLVMAGDIITNLIREYQVNLYPVDSEHSALWQVLKGEHQKDIHKLVITASGGSFRDKTRKELTHVKVEDALKHPNWKMGAKITIDSATMMNKGLEVIEAHHLFHLPYHQIETILHKESVVHGLIYFKDGTVKASLSVSDMRIPIAYALFYPNRTEYDQYLELKNLSFEPMNGERFPLLKLAYQVGEAGGLLPTVMNAANEAAVKLFLNHQISFLDIEHIVMDTVNQFKNIKEPSLDLIIDTDHQIQQAIQMAHEKR